ncbi:MAG: anti-sigma factor [Rhodoplanes sp.]|uniref:anti-sigma factor domain-containing protein n=1 Tax=Rhodoplanes sp. TaxID=1968906 RepID=UPI00184CF1C6|nr:anti-sigma factor [Rhodoplanes sp.]NVO16127.1 anti-sigma factor [Rhodoplanes sp.]
MTAHDDDWAGLAAEYVLGTLDADEREAAAALVAADSTFAALVTAWERRLGELHAMVDPVPPPPELWVALRARLTETIAAARPAAAAADAAVPEPPSPAMDDLLAAVAASLAEPVEPAKPAKPVEPVEPPPPVAPPEPSEAHAADESRPGDDTSRPAADLSGPETPAEAADSRAVVVRLPSPDERFGDVAGGLTGHDPETVRGLVRSVQRWRSAAAGFAAFAAALAALTVITTLAPDLLPLPLRPPAQVVEVPREVVRTVEVPGASPGRFVAVLQGNSARPAFLVTLDPDHKSVMVRRVAAEDEGDKRYELWLVSDRLPAPRSLGLLGGAEFTTVPAIATFEPEIVDAAVYAVSLEGPTGSPAAGPTGPVLFSGRLVEAVPPAQTNGR